MPAKALLIFIFILLMTSIAATDPIQKIQGVIVDLEHDHLLVKPENQEPVRFNLKWNVRFNPPRLPLKGDRVEILYKSKDEGLVIYGVNYIQGSSESPQIRSE